jgi:hypothetical protein
MDTTKLVQLTTQDSFSKKASRLKSDLDTLPLLDGVSSDSFVFNDVPLEVVESF